MPISKPALIPTWTEGGPSQVSQPPQTVMASGWTAGQPPVAQWMNWLQWQNGLWLTYLSEQTNSVQASAALDPSIRLAGGGLWSFNLATNTLAWSMPWYLLTPGLADTANVCAAGSVTIASGQVAYVAANLPFASQGDLTTGSATVANLTYQSGIAVGMQVTGAGVPSGTTVLSVGSGQITLSSNATATATQQALTFVSQGALTMQVAQESALQLAPNIVIVARALVQTVILGVGSGWTSLRNGEQKFLHEAGYQAVVQAVAGVALTAGQAVYMSAGAADSSRTAGAIYPLDAGVANGPMRSGFLGVVYTGGAAGSTCGVVTDGVVYTASGLIPGATYYADIQTPGGIAAAKPTLTNSYAVPIGTALSATALAINPAKSATATLVQSLNPWPNYGVATETQLQAALAVANVSGGVIVLTSPLSISQAYTVGSNVVIQGRKANTPVTVLAQASLLLSGDGAELRDVFFTTSAQTSCVAVSGNYNVLRACSFSLSGGNNNGALVTGNGNRLSYTQLMGTGASTTAVGINYAAGCDNIDDSTFVIS